MKKKVEERKSVAECGAVTVVDCSITPSPNHTISNYKERVVGQYAAIETAKDNLLRECVKFGALLMEVSSFLGNGQKRDGSGLCGWLAENCPEINYKTAMGYKKMGEMAAARIGGGSQAIAVLQDKTEVIPPGEAEPIDVESKFLEKRDQLFSEVKSRRDLEQTYFKFMASEGRARGGRPVGTKADTARKPDTTDVVAAARATWSRVIVPADRDAVALRAAAKLLCVEDVENAKIVLDILIDYLKDRAKELGIRI